MNMKNILFFPVFEVERFVAKRNTFIFPNGGGKEGLMKVRSFSE